MTRSLPFYASLGFPDVVIARMLSIPLDEMWNQLRALPPGELAKAVQARLYTAKIDNPRERFLHGDLGMNARTDGREQYLCSLCDAFVDDEAHFQQHTREQNIARFKFDLRVLAYEAGEGPVIRYGRSEGNVIERTMEAESDAECAGFLKSAKHGCSCR